MAEKPRPSAVNHDALIPQSVPAWLLRVFPLLGFVSGLLMWLMDAMIDVYLINPQESLLACIFSDTPTELWMRSLVVIVMTTAAVIAQRLLYRQKKTETLLRDYKLHLQELVEERTRELERLASLDPLTRIYNRRKFTEILNHEMQRSKRYHQSLSVVLCDLDNFKQVNDEYGHEVGDEVLIKVANSFSACLRNIDVYARWGGEEFILLLPQTELNEAKEVAEKIRQYIAEIKTDRSFQVTASCGISQLHEAEELLPLVKRADEALYRAKHTGRNCVIALE